MIRSGWFSFSLKKYNLFYFLRQKLAAHKVICAWSNKTVLLIQQTVLLIQQNCIADLTKCFCCSNKTVLLIQQNCFADPTKLFHWFISSCSSSKQADRRGWGGGGGEVRNKKVDFTAVNNKNWAFEQWKNNKNWASGQWKQISLHSAREKKPVPVDFSQMRCYYNCTCACICCAIGFSSFSLPWCLDLGHCWM